MGDGATIAGKLPILIGTQISWTRFIELCLTFSYDSMGISFKCTRIILIFVEYLVCEQTQNQELPDRAVILAAKYGAKTILAAESGAKTSANSAQEAPLWQNKDVWGRGYAPTCKNCFIE